MDVETPDPELIDEDNPEWTDEMFARAVPFSGLPQELQDLLSSPKHIKPDAETPTESQPAARMAVCPILESYFDSRVRDHESHGALYARIQRPKVPFCGEVQQSLIGGD
jgi:hypothetical protein